MESLNFALIIELGVLLVGFIIFFIRQANITAQIKSDIEDLKKETHKDADDLHTKLNNQGQQLVAATTMLETIQRKVINGG